MTKVLLIAGHGKRPNGSFDPGATGFISEGEHRYFRDTFFPAMKKYAPDNWEFHTAYNVFARGNLAQLAQGYDLVLEFHFDAAGSAARGGHLIIHPNARITTVIRRIRDVIGEMVGVRFSLNGERGFSGRTNLANPNRAHAAGLNYALLELGFGTNQEDARILREYVDDYARELVAAITQEDFKPTNPQKQAQSIPSEPKSISQLADEVNAGRWGVGEERRRKLEEAGHDYRAVQNEVNRRAGIEPERTEPSFVRLVVDGSFGPLTTRRLQEVLGTEVTGIIGGQSRHAITNNIHSVQFGTGGSMVVREMQRRLNVTVDGSFGPQTLRALQRRMGTQVTGAISPSNSAVVKELQRRLNRGTF